jgi:hypothetical protein
MLALCRWAHKPANNRRQRFLHSHAAERPPLAGPQFSLPAAAAVGPWLPFLSPPPPQLWHAACHPNLLPAPLSSRLQLSLEEYLAQGIVTEHEIEQCSPEQLSFLIRKRVTLAAKAAAAPPPSPSRGRSRGPVRNPPAAAVQPSAAAAPAAQPAAEEAPRKLVVPRAPPLTVRLVAHHQPAACCACRPAALLYILRPQPLWCARPPPGWPCSAQYTTSAASHPLLPPPPHTLHSTPNHPLASPPPQDNGDLSRTSSRSPSPVMRPMVAQAPRTGGGSLWVSPRRRLLQPLRVNQPECAPAQRAGPSSVSATLLSAVPAQLAARVRLVRSPRMLKRRACFHSLPPAGGSGGCRPHRGGPLCRPLLCGAGGAAGALGAFCQAAARAGQGGQAGGGSPAVCCRCAAPPLSKRAVRRLGSGMHCCGSSYLQGGNRSQCSYSLLAFDYLPSPVVCVLSRSCQADAVKLADKPEAAAKPAAAAKVEAPKPAPVTPPPPPAKVEARKEVPPPPPRAEEKKAAPAPPAAAAAKPEPRPLLSNPWVRGVGVLAVCCGILCVQGACMHVLRGVSRAALTPSPLPRTKKFPSLSSLGAAEGARGAQGGDAGH